MRRLRHGGILIRDLAGYAMTNGAYWVFPLMLLLAAAAMLIGVLEAVLPYTLYTLF